MPFRWSILAVLLCLLLTAGAVFADPPAGHGRARAPVAPRVLEDLAVSGNADVLVVFVEQADLRAARSRPTRTAKGRFVYEALTRAARHSQAGLRARLDARGVAYKAHHLGNLLRVSVDSDLLDEIAARPEVARVDANPWVRGIPDQPAPAPAQEAVSAIEWGVTRVGATDLWAAGHRGYLAVVATADTGVEWDHPAIKTKYRGWTGSGAVHDYYWHDAIDPLNGVPLDDHNHGTHVTGTMVGDDGAGNIIGVAPDAEWMGCRNMDAGNGSPGTYTECFEFFMAPYPLGGDPMVDGLPILAPDVINNSWTCPPSEGCSTDTLRTIVEQVRAAGILVVGAAGNSGPGCSSVDDPIAIYDATFTVGATDSNDNIASFSARGPVTADGSGRQKPDLSAPGVAVRSSIRGGNYVPWNGTSMASPHVAGVAALLRSANPALDGQPERLEALLLAGVRPMAAPAACGTEIVGAVPNNTFGHGIVHAADSLASDPDLDGFPIGDDNCPDDSNPDQLDTDLDGTGDACDCAPGDPALAGLPGEAGPALDWTADGSLLSWLAASGASGHDVYEAPQSPGVAPTFACLQADLPGTSTPVSGALGPGEIRSYVVAGRSCFGLGTIGTATGGAPRPTPPACP